MKTNDRIWLYSLLMVLGLILTNGCKKNEAPADKITDKDGNVYTSVTIGSQIWMVENLKTTKYNNGEEINNVTGIAEWCNLTTGAYRWYNNDIANKTVYGALYNWYVVVDNRKLCPIGWHVPSIVEWTALSTFLGGESIAGGKMKEVGTTHWSDPNTGATNESGFTAIPGGHYSCLHALPSDGFLAFFWSSSEFSASEAEGLALWNDQTNLFLSSYDKTDGQSVRCVKD